MDCCDYAVDRNTTRPSLFQAMSWLKYWTSPIHFGSGNSLDDAEIIGRYTHRFPEEEVTDADLRSGRLEMEIKADESIEVRACVADNVYDFNYQRSEPPFLNED